MKSGLFSLLILIAQTLFAVKFRISQNKNTENGTWVGGEISWPKAFWLAYAIGAWFFVPFVFLFVESVPFEIKLVLAIHTGIWWFRGVLEMVMIYKWFNWTPFYGISHDIAHNLIIGIGTAWAVSKIGYTGIIADKTSYLAVIYLFVTFLALMAEMCFAALFIMTREKGAHKIYFASDSPEYRAINRFTLVICVIVYTHMILQTIALLLP